MISQRLQDMSPGQKRKAIMAAVLMVLLVALLVNTMIGGPRRASAKAPAASTVSQKQAPADVTGWAQPREIVMLDWVDQLKGDPFDSATIYPPQPVKPVQQSPVDMPPVKIDMTPIYQRQVAGFKLQATIMSAQPTALIDGQVYHIGAMVNGFKIQNIYAGGIVLERDGIRISLEMSQP